MTLQLKIPENISRVTKDFDTKFSIYDKFQIGNLIHVIMQVLSHRHKLE